jgi:hypothetical protein
MLIASEQQAREVARHFDVWNDEDYKIFTYPHRPTKITLFGIELFSGTIITTDPRAAAPRKTGE